MKLKDLDCMRMSNLLDKTSYMRGVYQNKLLFDGKERIPSPQIQTAGSTNNQGPRRTYSSTQAHSYQISNANISQKKIFKTILITDSIMRHIPEDTLGTNHELYVLNYTGSSGLSEKRVRTTLEKMRPDFVYVHLGINDIFCGTDVKEISSKLGEFCLYASEALKETKVVISLPLLTKKASYCEQVRHLHAVTMGWIVKKAGDAPIADRQFSFNTNQNMRTTDWTPKSELLTYDGIHLTPSGKDLMMKNFRYRIHSMTKIANEKRRRPPLPRY